MIQVLLVTGGHHYPGGTWTRLDSTEILETSGGSWRTLTTARLPSPRYDLRAGTANNIVIVFGKKCLNVLKYSLFHPIYLLSGGRDGSTLDTILSFNKTEESWQPAGQMTVPRYYHAVEVTADVSKHCP